MKMDHLIGFRIHTGVDSKSFFFRDLMPCSPMKLSRRYGGTHSYHLQTQARNQSEADSTWADIQRAAQRCVPEGRTLHEEFREQR
jgi:hypothetical protein